MSRDKTTRFKICLWVSYTPFVRRSRGDRERTDETRLDRRPDAFAKITPLTLLALWPRPHPSRCESGHLAVDSVHDAGCRD